MGINFTIETAGGKQKELTGQACWASSGRVLKSMQEDKKLHFKEMFRVSLELSKGCAYYDDTPLRYRNLSDSIFDKLFSGWFHPDWVSYESTTPYRKARTRITYSGACPYYVMVVSSSIYRMHYDMSMFTRHWESIDDMQKVMGYKMHPWTQYFLVVSLCNSRNSHVDWMNNPVVIGSNTNHMAVSSGLVAIEGIQYMTQWNWHRFRDGDEDHTPRPSMYDEFWTEYGLAHSGRDQYLTISDDGNWLLKQAREHSILQENTSKYENGSKILLPEFIEKVLKPLNM